MQSDLRELFLQRAANALIVLVGLVFAYRSLLDQGVAYERRIADGRRRAVRRSTITWGILALTCLGPSLWVLVSFLERGVGPFDDPVWAGLSTAGLMLGLFAVGMVARLLGVLSNDASLR